MPPRKTTAHNGGHVQRTQYGTWAATYNYDGNRYRTTCKTREAACEWIDLKAAETRLRLDPATPTEMADAAEARRILGGRCSLVEAARLWERSSGTLTPITVRDAVGKYIELRERDNLRTRSIQTTRHRINPLLTKYPDAFLHSLTPDDLRATQTGSAVTRNNTRRYYITFWGWALRQGHVIGNIASALTIAQGSESLPVSLTVEQAKRLLITTRDNDVALLPWLCVGLFAGLRTAELERVTDANIRDGKIHLDPSITKLRDRRILDLLPPLTAWLEAYPPTGALLKTNHRKRWKAIRDVAGVTDWPNNALRHSFATYHLAAYQDAAKTAHYTRHESQATLHRHYIDLATNADGLAYFALTPESLKEQRIYWQDLGKSLA